MFSQEQAYQREERARSPLPSKDTRRDKYNSHGKMVEEVDEILKKLKEKYAGNYDETRLRAWAHMVHIGTHKSLDDPPDMLVLSYPSFPSPSHAYIQVTQPCTAKSYL